MLAIIAYILEMNSHFVKAFGKVVSGDPSGNEYQGASFLVDAECMNMEGSDRQELPWR